MVLLFAFKLVRAPSETEIFSVSNRILLPQPFIITRQASCYDGNTVKKDVKSQVIHSFYSFKLSPFHFGSDVSLASKPH